mmetsp:Transcript_92730/g.181702  ORF Transcript_92730/g.181702 Transcript_92730/m.181702 type:complete len:229 (-) Transcript_92730:13-699(-)
MSREQQLAKDRLGGPHYGAGTKKNPRKNNREKFTNKHQTSETTDHHSKTQLNHDPNSTENSPTDPSDNEEWGDQLVAANPSQTRIGFQNIGPQRASSWSYHSKNTTSHIKEASYDVFLFADHGLHFGKIHPEHHWNERIKPIFKDSSSILGYNVNETSLLTSPHQAGGTGITLGDDLTARKTHSGTDPTGLGRWSWIRIQGKQGFTTIFVAAYRPNDNRRDSGSVWNP